MGILSLSLFCSACASPPPHTPSVSPIMLQKRVYHVTGRSTTVKGMRQGPFTFFTLLPSSSDIENMVKGPDGALWFEQGDNGLIGRITETGQLTTFSLRSVRNFQIPVGNPLWITVGPDHALWLTDTAAIERLALDGTLTIFLLPTFQESPSEITAGPDGALWFLEYGAQNLLSRLTLQGVLTQFPLPSPTTGSLASGPLNALWFLESFPTGGGAIGRMTTDGKLAQFPLPQSIGGNELIVGPDGNLWFGTDQGRTKQIGRVLPNGHVTFFSLGRTGSIQRIASDGYGSLVFTTADAAMIGFMTTQGKVSKMFPFPHPEVYPLALTTVQPGEYWFSEDSANNTSSQKSTIGVLRLP